VPKEATTDSHYWMYHARLPYISLLHCIGLYPTADSSNILQPSPNRCHLKTHHLLSKQRSDICTQCTHKSIYALQSRSVWFNGYFPGGPGLAGTRMSPSWILMELRVMEVVVTTGAVSRAKLQSKCHHQQTNTQFILQTGCRSCHPTNSVKALQSRQKKCVFSGLAKCLTVTSNGSRDAGSPFQIHIAKDMKHLSPNPGTFYGPSTGEHGNDKPC